MTEPNKAFLDGKTPTITLADIVWPVPKLAPRQNRIVVPAILQVAPKVLYALATPESDPTLMPIRLSAALDTSSMDALGDVCYWALKRAHPDMTRDEFDDMPISVLEMALALKVVSQQTGLIKEAAPSPLAPGAQAAPDQSSQTGTQLSPA